MFGVSKLRSAMSALRTGLLVGLLLAQLVAAAHIGFTQTSRSLENRIPKPDPKKYHSVQDAKDWKNPYLIVRRDGIEIVGMTPVGRAITVESVQRFLCRHVEQSDKDSSSPWHLVPSGTSSGQASGFDFPKNEKSEESRCALRPPAGRARGQPAVPSLKHSWRS